MMKKGFLAAASAAALTIGGTAHAVDLTIGDAAATGEGTSLAVASELDFASTPLTGNLSILINIQGTYPADDNVVITLTLTGPAEFNGTLTGNGEITDGNDMVTSDNALVSSGGGAGGTTVTYIVDTNTAEDSLGFLIPISMTGCGSVGVTLDSITSQGNPIEGGTASLQEGTADGNPATMGDMAASAFTCADSYALTVMSDETAEDTQLELTGGFTLLGDALVGGDEQNTTAPLGTITSVITANALDLANANQFAGPNVTGVDFVLQFGDLTNIDLTNTTVGPVACTQIGMTNQVECLNVQEANLTGGATVTVGVTGTANAPVNQQNVSVFSSTANLADVNGDLVDTTSEATGALDRIQFEGQNFGPFDWARDSQGSINHVFRTTGLPAATIDGVISISNSSANAGALDGTYAFQVDPSDISNGEWIINSRQIATDIVGGDFGRADITFTFFVSQTLDVDRSVVSGGVFADFGDCGNDSCASGASSGDTGTY